VKLVDAAVALSLAALFTGGDMNEHPAIIARRGEAAGGVAEDTYVYEVALSQEYYLMVYYPLADNGDGTQCHYYNALLSFSTLPRLLDEL
jgi:hypothetical protein